ncbi:MAG: hypothetical protein NDJ89_04160 [Oligoflexia bacterium]|nr:hypothetical protein [Oligoflexia bacterium]
MSNSIEYEVEIYRDAVGAEGEAVLERRLTPSVDAYFRLPLGSYRYRIRGVHRLGIPGPWGPIETFVLTPEAPLALPEEPRTPVPEVPVLPGAVPPAGQLAQQGQKVAAIGRSLGVALTRVSYQDSNYGAYRSFALTGKAGVSYDPRPWSFHANAFATLATLAGSEGITARFLGVNVRAGVPLAEAREVPESWSLRAYGGYYYTTMFVSDDLFGFRNMHGPQLYPAFQKTLSGDERVAFYLKFSPVSPDFGDLSLSNRELAAGAAWSRGPLSVTLDVSDIRLNVAGVGIRNSTLSLGAAWSF